MLRTPKRKTTTSLTLTLIMFEGRGSSENGKRKERRALPSYVGTCLLMKVGE